MAYLADSIWVNVSTSGTADFTTTTALAGYRTFADASTPNGSTIHYSARSATQFENGEGIYSSGTGIVTRATIFASSSAGAKVNFSGSPTLVVAPLAEDFGGSALTIGTTTISSGTTKRVLYDLAGVVQEAASFTIESGEPQVAAGKSYMYDGSKALSSSGGTNWHLGPSGNFTMTATRMTTVGFNCGVSKTSGDFNVLIGSYCAQSMTTGASNVAIGDAAMFAVTSGCSNNVAIGQGALAAATTGASSCVAIGVAAMGSGSGGTANVAVGAAALQNATSTSLRNMAIGDSALNALTDGADNLGLGFGALDSIATGGRCVAIGSGALGAYVSTSPTAGATAIGYSAAANLTTGTTNTIIGYNTGLGITTGSNNTVVGASVSGLAADLANSIVIADGAGNIKFDYNKTTASVLTLNADTAVLGTLRLQGYTIAGTLPAAGTAGRRAYVTNSAASPAFMATLTGGGSTIVPVFDDGTNWRYG